MSSLSYVLSLALALGLATCAKGLECHEGFNMSIGGIPLNHWMERTCIGSSECFGQALKSTFGVPVVMSYGACVSAQYAGYLECEKLFGPNSDVNLTDLLDLMPDVIKPFSDAVQDVVIDPFGQLKLLLSSGQGMFGFVDGILAFCKIIGFNVEKARPLIQPLANFLSEVGSGDDTAIQRTETELFRVIGNLDTANEQYKNGIYNLINNIDPSGREAQKLRNSAVAKPLIERLPGLIRSVIPARYVPALWYDVVFNLLNDLNVTMPKKTVEDMVDTIKETYTIPAFLNPILDRIPNLAEKLAQRNWKYIGNWTLDLLMQYSEENNATTAFSDAAINFLEKLFHQTLPYQFRMIIKRLPGFLYKLFPGDKPKMEKVYTKIAEGLNTFEFTDVTITKEAKSIIFSDLIHDLVDDEEKIPFLQTFSDSFGKNLASVENFLSKINPLKILSGWKTIVKASLYAMTTIADAFKDIYPNSPFQGVMEKSVKGIKHFRELNWIKQNPIDELKDVAVEVLVSLIGDIVDEFTQMAGKASPDQDIYVKLIQVIGPEDTKQLVEDIIQWARSGDYTSEAFVTAIEPSVRNISESTNGLFGDVRKILQPESCKSSSCGTDFCNSHAYIDSLPPMVKLPAVDSNGNISNEYTGMAKNDQSSQNGIKNTAYIHTVSPSNTTGAGEQATVNVFLNTASLWIAYQALFG